MFFGQTKGAGHLSNTLRRVGAPVIAILFTMLLTVVTWGQTLDKGTYTISNNVSHDNPVGQGMARSYTEETSDVEVNDSGIFVTLGFNNTQYMGDFAISVGGSKVTYETTTHANNIKKLKFKVPSLSSSIKVGLYVTAMDTNVEYTVTLNESSLKLIKKAETAPQENTSSTTTSTSHTTGSGTSGNNTVTNSGTTNNSATSSTGSSAESNTGSSTNSTTTTNKVIASIATSNSNTSSAQGSNASKNNAQATTNKVTTEQAASSEAAPKNEVKAEKAEVAKTETAKEEAKQVDIEAVSQDETKVEVKDEVKVEADSAGQDAVETKTDAEAESEVEGQVENQEEVTAEQAEEDGIIEAEESEGAVISSGNNLGMILIICGITVGAIIGVVIYLKRK